MKTKHNAERRSWRGVSYKNGGRARIRTLRVRAADKADRRG